LSLLEYPLREVHRRLGANFGEFAGWRAPLDYGSVVDEHLAVRSSAGVFDLSHMGRVFVEGPDAHKLLDKLVPRYIESEPGQMVGPTAFLNEHAGFRDDIMLYNLGEGRWLVVPNAVNRVKVVNWLEDWASRLNLTVRIEDRTLELVMLALQGPRAVDALKVLGPPGDVVELKLLRFKTDVVFEKARARAFLISRSGWTGEDGFEIIAEPDQAEKILLALVEEANVKPCGLAARDTLRIEMGYVLYGADIDEDTNPIEARYWWVFQPGPKEDCVGCRALRDAMRSGASRVRVGLKLDKKARIVPRHGDRVFIDDVEIGVITSGAYSPVLRRPIAMAYVKASHALMGLTVEVERRGRRYRAKIVDFPFVVPSSRPPT
jgi:aminomethyltransferase